MFGMLFINKNGQHKLANIIELGADLIKKFMLLGGHQRQSDNRQW